MTGLEKIALAALAVVVALVAGCGDTHIEDCEGGLLVTVNVSTELLGDADELYVRLTTDQGVEERTWPATELSSGTGTALVHFPSITSDILVMGYAELRTEGDIVIAQAMGAATVEPADTGCFDMLLSLGDPDVDGGAGAADAGVTDADPDAPDAAPPQDAAVPDADQGLPDAGIIDATPGLPDAGISDADIPDATPFPVDAMVDAAIPVFDDGGIQVPDGDGGIMVNP